MQFLSDLAPATFFLLPQLKLAARGERFSDPPNPWMRIFPCNTKIGLHTKKDYIPNEDYIPKEDFIHIFSELCSSWTKFISNGIFFSDVTVAPMKYKVYFCDLDKKNLCLYFVIWPHSQNFIVIPCTSVTFDSSTNRDIIYITKCVRNMT